VKDSKFGSLGYLTKLFKIRMLQQH